MPAKSDWLQKPAFSPSRGGGCTKLILSHKTLRGWGDLNSMSEANSFKQRAGGRENKSHF